MYGTDTALIPMINLSWKVNLLGQGTYQVSGSYKRSVGSSVCCSVYLRAWGKWEFRSSYMKSNKAIDITGIRGYYLPPRAIKAYWGE